MFPTRLLFSENIVATLYPGPAAAAAPQRAASFWPQKPQLFVGSIHCVALDFVAFQKNGR